MSPTWLPVSTHDRGLPFVVFQNRMQRSAVPPPEARSPCWWGDQARAFTAAWCCWKRSTGCVEDRFQTSSCKARRKAGCSFHAKNPVGWLRRPTTKLSAYFPLLFHPPDCHFLPTPTPSRLATISGRTPLIYGLQVVQRSPQGCGCHGAVCFCLGCRCSASGLPRTRFHIGGDGPP